MTQPIPMVLHCPACRYQHIDKPDPARGWDDRPHRTHKCQACGEEWRPANVATTGVKVLPPVELSQPVAAALVTQWRRDSAGAKIAAAWTGPPPSFGQPFGCDTCAHVTLDLDEGPCAGCTRALGPHGWRGDHWSPKA